MDKTVIAEILQPGDEKTQKRRARKVRARFADTLRKAAAQLPFIEDVVAGYYCAFDPATPTRVRATLLAAFTYFVMPIDLIPDMLALVGFSDDIAVLTVALAAVRSHITPAHRKAAHDALEQRAEMHKE